MDILWILHKKVFAMALADHRDPTSPSPPLPSPPPLTSLPFGQLVRLARVAGYGLLLMSFVDFLYVLIPPDLMDPVWEYQFTGDLVKLIPVPLLALVLVFWGEASDRQKAERSLLQFLSWLTLLFSVVLFLLIPLTLANTIRIHRYNNEQINTQVTQQQQQIDATRSQLERATPEQLQQLVPVPDENGQLPQAPDSPEQAKAQILDGLTKSREQATSQAQQARANVRQNLIKNTLKLTIESLIGSLLFFYTWLVTRWARHPKSYIQSEAAMPTANPATQVVRQWKKRLRWKPRRMRRR